jgi:23S rRNA pseudouridine2605 synthase
MRKRNTSGSSSRSGKSSSSRSSRSTPARKTGDGKNEATGKRFSKNSKPRSRGRNQDSPDTPRSNSKAGKRSAASRSEHGEKRSASKGFFSKTKRSSSPNKRSSSPSKRTKSPTGQEGAPQQTEKIRLNRFIANSGVCSRREADQLITMGLISVNGKTITELGYKVNPGDEVRYENKVLRAEKPVYILLNKPKGYLTTTNDPQERNTVMHLVGNAVKERIYPVGRLDRNTTGLLLLTNDGELADKLMHPSYNVKKIYKVELDRPLTKADAQKILDGVHLEEGKALVDNLAVISEDGKTVGLELHIGWNRVVRRIFEALEYTVVNLDRSVYAGLDKKELPRGHWRFLTKEEIIRLKHYQ